MMRLLVLVCVLSLAWAALPGRCLAAFPKPDYYELYSLQQGWYNDQPAWFTCTTASSIDWLTTVRWTDFWSPWFPSKPDLAPKLICALQTDPKVARPVYVVTNSGQAPVFDTRPGADDYSGLWQVFLVMWLPGHERGFSNTDPVSASNPRGLPDSSEAVIAETDVVLDCPILALGRLGGPWKGTPNGCYRIPQGLDSDPSSLPKWVMLPHFIVDVENGWNWEPTMSDIAITDAADKDTAKLLGANWAPRLALLQGLCTQNLCLMSGPKPPGQLPMIEETFGDDFNPAYTPAAEIILLDRHFPAYVTVYSGRLFEMLLANGRLTFAGSEGVVNIHAANVFY